MANKRRKLSLLPVGLLSFWSCATGGSPSELASGPGSWESLPAGDAPMHRHENGYVRVGARFYLVGGRGERPIEIFDPITRTWTTGAAAPMELHHFQAVEYEGRVYVLGAMTGRYPTEPPVPAVQIYDPAMDRWSEGVAVPGDRRRGGAGVVVHDGLIYLVAGIQNGHTDGHVAWLDSFDPRTGEWRRLADAPRARDHFHAAVIDGKIYAAGGRRSSAGTGQPFELTIAEVDVYDLESGQWSTLPSAANLPTPRAGSAVAVLNGRLLVLGGESGVQQAAHSEVEAYDPATGRWISLSPLLQGRHGTQAIVHDNEVYIAAGSRTRGATEINSQEIFSQRPR
jgi:large repetitive protein